MLPIPPMLVKMAQTKCRAIPPALTPFFHIEEKLKIAIPIPMRNRDKQTKNTASSVIGPWKALR